MNKNSRAWEIHQAAVTLSRVCYEIGNCKACPLGDSDGRCRIPGGGPAPKDWQEIFLTAWADFMCRQVPGVKGFADMERIMASKSSKEAKVALYDIVAKAFEQEAKE